MNPSLLPRLLLFALVACAAAGCGPDLDTTYGKRRSMWGEKSVNGTSVLVGMFGQSGHRVRTWPRLSPRLWERADVIVWFVDDFTPLSVEAREWLERWLFAGDGRTLIVVGRDFDAAPGYWEKMKVGVPAEQAAEVNRRLAEARSEQLAVGFVAPQDSGWFTLDNQLPARDVRALSGAPEWLAGVDPAKVEIKLGVRMIVPDRPDLELLLSSGADAIVAREVYGTSQLLLVANGSFLLNLPLVNHEHRKLARRLIDSVGQDRNVYFLEASGDPLILDEEPEATVPTGLELFAVPPLGLILLHLTLLGLVFCFFRLPLFGVPRRLESGSQADFGEHVRALGELLAKTRNHAFALARIDHYYTTVRREAPPSRPAALAGPSAEPPPPPRDPWDEPAAVPPPLPPAESDGPPKHP
jgi:hypothetical protein